ncbi:MAG: amidohydrolase family protein [Chitinophagaceae bacterium]|nr:amidohydrolase family protein [Chitinophagaceae bacterium]
MILHDITRYGKPGRYHVRIRNGKIHTITSHRKELDKVRDPERLELDGALLLPGFINTHDHLDFNCFPAAGHHLYEGYREWVADVNNHDTDTFKKVLQIPLPLRTAWGVYKNLLNGFTTVVNHGEKLKIKKPVTGVYQEALSLHSVAFEKNWAKKLKAHKGKKKPVIIHAGEGVTGMYSDEIDELLDQLPKSVSLIAVHGVAMKPAQAKHFSALVWCPVSNDFLFGRTAAIDQVKKNTAIIFGTDSTLTASWNAWSHFRLAMESGMVTENELLQMLTVHAAGVLDMKGKGVIEEKALADLIIIPPVEGTSSLFSFQPGDIQLVMQKGRVRMISQALSKQIQPVFEKNYSLVSLQGQLKMISGNPGELIQSVRKYYPEMETGGVEW